MRSERTRCLGMFREKLLGWNVRQMKLYQENWKERLNALDQDTPLTFQSWDDWDEDGRARPVCTQAAFQPA